MVDASNEQGREKCPRPVGKGTVPGGWTPSSGCLPGNQAAAPPSCSAPEGTPQPATVLRRRGLRMAPPPAHENRGWADQVDNHVTSRTYWKKKKGN
jgi:hypothetical protein